MRAAEIIETHRCAEFTADRWYVVEQWLSMLAPDVKSQHPKLLLSEAWIASCRHQMARIPAIVEAVKSLICDQQVEQTVSGELALFEGSLAYWEGRTGLARQRLEEAVEHLSGHVTPWLGEAELYLGLVRCMANERDVAVQALKRRIGASGSSDGQLRSRLTASLVFIHSVSGDLPQACAESEQLLRLAKEIGHNTEAWAHYLLGSAHLHGCQLTTAADHFAKAVNHQYAFEPMAAISAFSGLALSQRLLQRDEEAAQTIREMEQYAEEVNELHCLSVARSCQARLRLLSGDLEPAIEWARSLDSPPVPSELFMWLEVPAITQARALIAAGTEGDLAKATTLLGEVRQISETCRFVCQVVEVSVLQSLILDRQGRADEALTALRDALILAEPGGWVRPFVEQGQPMARLLRQLPSRNAEAQFVSLCLAAYPENQSRENGFLSAREHISSSVSLSGAAVTPRLPGSDSPAPNPNADVQHSYDPLTNRELDTLQLLAERLYDKEIAKALSISVSTVRTHAKHIYEKLHVRNRRQAVLRAEELGLLTGE